MGRPPDGKDGEDKRGKLGKKGSRQDGVEGKTEGRGDGRLDRVTGKIGKTWKEGRAIQRIHKNHGFCAES